MSTPVCPRCGHAVTRRLKREGFLQNVILIRFKVYPWECTQCRVPFRSRNRGATQRKRVAED